MKQLLSDLTLEEKVSLNTGSKEPVYAGQAGYTSGVPRLGIPDLRWADGSRGINGVFDGTALPSSMSMAATFSPEIAYQSGVLLGEEARAMGIDVVPAPFVHFAPLPGSSTTEAYDANLAGEPIGFMQSYAVVESGGGWWNSETDPRGRAASTNFSPTSVS